MANEVLTGIIADLGNIRSDLFQISDALRTVGLPINRRLSDIANEVKDLEERLVNYEELLHKSEEQKDTVLADMDFSIITASMRAYAAGKMTDEEVQCLIKTYDTLGKIFDAIREANPRDDMFGTMLRHAVRIEHRRFYQMMENRNR